MSKYDEEKSLCDELEKFCKDNKLPHMSADELLCELQAEEVPNDWRTKYLTYFMIRWEEFMKRHY